jgi:hypothetical protein
MSEPVTHTLALGAGETSKLETETSKLETLETLETKRKGRLWRNPNHTGWWHWSVAPLWD